MSEKRVVVLMPKDMADYLDQKAKQNGMGNTSALLRFMVRQMMDDESTVTRREARAALDA